MLYSIYGLCLSTEVAVPWLRPCESNRVADVNVRLTPAAGRAPVEPVEPVGEDIWYRSLAQSDTTGEPILTILKSARDASFRLRYLDGVEFYVDAQGTEVRGVWPPTSSVEDAALYLTGPVLGFLLRLRGVISLHASVVAVDGRAVAFAGPSGAGKSTTAAAFARLGYPVLTEDLAALFRHDDGFSIHPGYPHVDLWPDSVAMIYGSVEALPVFTPGWDKRCLDLSPSAGFADRPLPLAAIYLLGDRDNSQPPTVAAMAPGPAMVGLIANIYGSRLFHPELRIGELDLIRDLAAAVPVRGLIAGRDLSLLSELSEVIVDDLSRDFSPASHSSHSSRASRASRGPASRSMARDVQHS